MVKQLTMFEMTDLSILDNENWKKLAKSNETIEIAFQMLKSLQIEDWVALNKIIQLRFNFDIVSCFEELEHSGIIQYFTSFQLFGVEFSLFEFHLSGTIELSVNDNSIEIFKWTEKEAWNNTTEQKIRNIIKETLQLHKAQISFLLNQ